MKKLYEKSEMTFAIVWIVIYCVLQSAAYSINEIIGIQYFANAVFGVILTVILFLFFQKNGLMERYGLCKTHLPARKFLWYIPLVILISHNLWNGAAINLPFMDTMCCLVLMLCVGFLEEVIFRGLLFRAIAKDNLKSAIIISSVTFGLGHLLNLLNGSGMSLTENLFQISGAIAIGFLFILLYYRGGSLIPCIITHSGINMASTFANETGLTIEQRILFHISLLVIVIVYALILNRTLPKEPCKTVCGK